MIIGKKEEVIVLFKQIAVTEGSSGVRLDHFLRNLGRDLFSFNQIQSLVRKKLIRVTGSKTTANYRLQMGDVIEIADFLLRDANGDLVELEHSHGSKRQVELSSEQIKVFQQCIVYRDANLLAINKPYGLPVQGGSKIRLSVADFLPYLQFEAEEIPRLVHRIDRYTSGLLLLARTKAAAQELNQRFQERYGIHKIYQALVLGIPKLSEGTINLAIKKTKLNNNLSRMVVDPEGDEAITHYKVLKSYSEIPTITNTDAHRIVSSALLELEIMTGKMHQIRVHLRELGHPIIGDGKYGGRDVFISGLSNKLHLLAAKLQLENFLGKDLELTVELPKFFADSLRKLAKYQGHV